MLKVNLSRKDIKRIMSKIEVDPVSDCWVWNGAIVNGYGQTWYGDRLEYTHRVLFAWLVVPLPKGLGHQTPVLDHVVCDNPLCSNPFHLELTTNRKNVLRGNSPVAKNARKSHCSKGHPLRTPGSAPSAGSTTSGSGGRRTRTSAGSTAGDIAPRGKGPVHMHHTFPESGDGGGGEGASNLQTGKSFGVPLTAALISRRRYTTYLSKRTSLHLLSRSPRDRSHRMIASQPPLGIGRRSSLPPTTRSQAATPGTHIYISLPDPSQATAEGKIFSLFQIFFRKLPHHIRTRP